MPRIRFTADPKLPRDWADKPYRRDYETEMSQDEAERWLRRGVAVIVPEMKPKAEAKPDAKPASSPPAQGAAPLSAKMPAVASLPSPAASAFVERIVAAQKPAETPADKKA